MNNSILIIIILISFLQSVSWIVRKQFTQTCKLNKNTIIAAESLMISLFLFTYIFFKISPQKLVGEFKKITGVQYIYLISTSICVVATLILVYDLIKDIDISTLGPSIDIIRILMLTVFGFLFLDETITFRKVMALIFMTIGLSMLIN
tara:strand:+ start:1509 stop:1952 length:444 start_codon:yes stop_codon:yes gene_type:complete